MDDYSHVSLEAGQEQLRYASILEKGMLLGLGVLLITFVLYATGVVEPYVALDEVPRLWNLPVDEYLREAGVQSGWSWVGMLQYGDFLNFVGPATLASVTVICYARIVPILWRNDDRIYVVLSVLEVIVLSTAASGVLGGGGH
jgi:hypothetical protein